MTEHAKPNGPDRLESDEFIVYETTETKQTGVKRKSVYSNDVENEKRCKTNGGDTIEEKPKILLCSPDTVELIPKSPVFWEPIGCLLCTYSTNVRSNLISHLNGHRLGLKNTAKEIVNPVLTKSKRMLDKTIDLSASSLEAINTEKTKIIEMNNEIVDVAFEVKINLESYPPFITRTERFKCSIPSCIYTSIDADMLKMHITTLHPDSQSYLCPHCVPSSTINNVVELNNLEFHLMHHSENLYKCQYCNYIDFNCDEMKTHMRFTHLALLLIENQSNIIVIRRTILKDDCIDGNRLKARTIAAHWICNVCNSGVKYKEKEIISHICMAHGIWDLFKCSMCQFEYYDNDTEVFKVHYELEHPSVAVKIFRVFEKVTDAEIDERQKQAIRLFGSTSTHKQQALESIEPSRRPTCRGIPVSTTAASRAYNKLCGVSKSASGSSSLHDRKQKILSDGFSVDDSLGAITATGRLSCPRCNDFKTRNIDHFRDHLLKHNKFKIWYCMKCFKTTECSKKMVWHVKKHKYGSEYETIEVAEKLHWVKRVIAHQNKLIKKLQKNKYKHLISV